MRLPVGADAHLQRAADLDFIPAADLRRQGGIDHVPLAQGDVVLGQDVRDRCATACGSAPRCRPRRATRSGYSAAAQPARRSAPRPAPARTPAPGRARAPWAKGRARRPGRGRSAPRPGAPRARGRRPPSGKTRSGRGRRRPGRAQTHSKFPSPWAVGPSALPSAGRISLPRTEIVHCIASLSIWVAGVLPSGHIVRDLRLPVKFPRAKKAVFPQKTGFFAQLFYVPRRRDGAPRREQNPRKFFLYREGVFRHNRPYAHVL